MSPTNKRALVHVVAGVLSDASGKVLLAQRPAGTHMAGGWEFPGGKLEPGESRYSALRRELDEELGVILDAARPLMRVTHAYPQRDIDLDVWLVTDFRGEPRPLDGQRLRWCDRDALGSAQLLPADVPIVTALQLPQRIGAMSGSGFRIFEADAAREACGLIGIFCDGLADARAAVAGGADFVVLRRRLDAAQIAAICAGLNVPVFAHGIALPDAWALGAIGVSDFETHARHGQT